MNRSRRVTFYRRFKYVIQLWAIFPKGISVLTDEKWHYIRPRLDTRKSQYILKHRTFNRKAFNHGRHYNLPLNNSRHYRRKGVI